MRVIDLTYLLDENTPVYPGTQPPILKRVITLEEHRNRETLLTMYSHTGTHVDPPAHMIDGGAYLEDMPVGSFIGRGVLLDLSMHDVARFEVSHFEPHAARIAHADYLLLKTGWSRHWGTPQYYVDSPYISVEAARYLATFSLRGIGLDTISIDEVNSPDFPSHRIVMERGMVVVENLANLDEIREPNFLFGFFPLKFHLGDGSPVRAIAVEGRLGE